MNKKIIWIIIIVVVIIGAVIVILNLPKKSTIPATGQGEKTTPVVVPEGTVAAPELNLSQIVEPKAIVPGASPVTGEGKILTDEGKIASPEGVAPGAKETPKPSAPIEENKIPKSALTIKVSAQNGYEPSQFRAKAGQVVTLCLVGLDDKSHSLNFRHPSLSGLVITIIGTETRCLTFNAPIAGTYEFACSNPDHSKEVGQMFITE
ncbi:MAG: cupredoxin domain-containing protein [Patescibacteria group bacterium]|nr:cupredoxin domain-containing protein [Patescibacteria group bacterium]MDD5164813.1 cupredoxin domain-containing protein [Patescibacteria group bacterium]MDD5534444.1 cupredoxin domain-containing protein [Patescibacteria group bacterium]